MFDKLIEMAYELKDLPQGNFRHFTFIVRKNKVLSMGWNKGFKTHPSAKKLGYKFSGIHSELDAFQNLTYQYKQLIHKCNIVNIRINNFGQIRLSKPCRHCEPWLKALNARNIYYSTNEGFNLL